MRASTRQQSALTKSGKNEHESLLAAIEAGDGALARREMERHLEHVGENLQAYFAGRK